MSTCWTGCPKVDDDCDKLSDGKEHTGVFDDRRRIRTRSQMCGAAIAAPQFCLASVMRFLLRGANIAIKQLRHAILFGMQWVGLTAELRRRDGVTACRCLHRQLAASDDCGNPHTL
jgi:hypothetical protein